METNPRPQRPLFLRALVTRAALMTAFACGTVACLGTGDAFVVRQPEHRPTEGSEDVLLAGVTEVDITPPPGLPTYGYSFSGYPAAEGYWTRLKGRVIALSRGKKHLVMVQLDLGATSSIVQRELARRLGDLGLGPESLLIASTHTHAGPGGFFGEKFFNGFVAASAGFDPNLVDFFVTRIERGVRYAEGHKKRARLKIAQTEVDARASHNRSRAAWERNFADLGIHPPARDVDPTLTLLRVDTSDDGVRFTPAAAWTVFGVHGTSVPGEYPLYHGDIHGYAARLIAHKVEMKYGVSGFVAATANGAEGDVSPGTGAPGQVRNRELTRQVAGYIADGATRAMDALDCENDDGFPVESSRNCDEENAHAAAMTFDVAYAEVSIRGANTTQGRLCQMPFLGAPVLAGSEEGRGPVQGAFGIAEGSIRTPGGCDSTKVHGAKTFLGPMLHDLILHEGDFPDVVPFQTVVFRAGSAPAAPPGAPDPSGPPEPDAPPPAPPPAPDLVLGMWPGEPTTEIALRAERSLSGVFAGEKAVPAAIVAHANGYALYFTTGSEFVAQHYEGGNSIYGPHQGQFAVEQLTRLAKSIRSEAPIVSYRPRRVFHPGEDSPMLPTGDACDPTSWGPLDMTQDARTVTFHYTGAAAGERCELPAVHVACGGRVLVDDQGFRQTDEGLFFEVRNLDGSIWSATWTKRAKPRARCNIVVTPSGGATPITSPSFVVE